MTGPTVGRPGVTRKDAGRTVGGSSVRSHLVHLEIAEYSPPVTSRREQIEAEDFERRRAVAALYCGDTLEADEVPPRPTGSVVAGLVIVLLICAGAAAAAFLSDRAPDGWLADGTLVVDEESGARYVAQDGTLRPTPTITGALLAGAKSEPVLVSSERVAQAPAGLPLPGAGLPERPPALPAIPTGFTACVVGSARLEVFAGEPAYLPSGLEAVLVRAVGSPEMVLLSERRAFRISPDAVTALGYTLAQVREVPGAWIALVPPGPELTLLRPGPGRGAGVPGVGASGDIVASGESGRRFFVADGVVRPLVNRTSELLSPPPARVVPDPVLLAAPTGLPAGIVDAPSAPPALPDRESVVVPCVRSSDGLLTVAVNVGDAGTRPAPTRALPLDGAPTEVTWHFPPGQGALVGPPDLDRPRPMSEAARGGVDGVLAVSDGVGYPVSSQEALRALAYRRDQVVLLPTPWLALLDRGAALATAG